MTDWLFVSGPGRSGTKLLAWCLGQHPDIRMGVHESAIAEQVLKLFKPSAVSNFPVEWTADGGLYWFQTAHLLGGGLEYEYELEPERMAAAALAGLRDNLCPDKRYLGDKAPGYCETWPLVRQLCPRSRFVFIKRDVDASVQSWQRQGFCNGDEAEIRRTIKARLAHAAACPGAIWLELEALNAAPEEQLSKVFVALDLDPARAPWEGIVAQVKCLPHLN